jgi:hypothetical protein
VTAQRSWLLWYLRAGELVRQQIRVVSSGPPGPVPVEPRLGGKMPPTFQRGGSLEGPRGPSPLLGHRRGAEVLWGLPYHGCAPRWPQSATCAFCGDWLGLRGGRRFTIKVTLWRAGVEELKGSVSLGSVAGDKLVHSRLELKRVLELKRLDGTLATTLALLLTVRPYPAWVLPRVHEVGLPPKQPSMRGLVLFGGGVFTSAFIACAA